MSANHLKIVVSLLKEISEGVIPTKEDYGVDAEVFGNIIEAITDKGVIKGAVVSRAGQGNKVQFYKLDGARLTLDGMEYLSNNSSLMKTYRGLKEVREWLPF